jgi:hypothetical protein
MPCAYTSVTGKHAVSSSSHQFGYELWLIVGELQRSLVCRSSDEVLDTQESWKAATLEEGWR